jgi:hypothetical protein
MSDTSSNSSMETPIPETVPNNTNKISKDEFVIMMAFRIITERHIKELTSEQRKTLGIKDAKDAKQLQSRAILLFCGSCYQKGLNVSEIAKHWTEKTKAERMDIYRRAMIVEAREKTAAKMLGATTN